MSTKVQSDAFDAALRCHREGRLAEAARLYQAILAQWPDDARCLHALGLLRSQEGYVEEAVDWLRRAVAQDPDFAGAYADLGVLFQKLGRLEEAAAAYARAVALNADQPEGHYALGSVLRKLDRIEEATASYEQALVLDPDFAEAHYDLGLLLHKAERYKAAAEHFEQALDVDPDYLEARSSLGLALHRLDRSEEALACLQQVLAAKPDLTDALSNLGVVLRDMGRIGEARRALEQAIAMSPNARADYYFNLAQCARFPAGDPHLAGMEALAGEIASLPAADRTYLHFALGKAYDDIGRYEESLRHYLDGNALKRRQVVYDEERTLGVMARIQQVFTPDLMAEKAGLGFPATEPVFIVGMPRSGSTLVEQILASHPQVYGAGEIPAFGDTLAKSGGAAAAPPPYPQLAKTISGGELTRLGTDYMERVRRLAPAAERIVDKALMNFVFVGLIRLALPKARIIHTRRDPVDTCISCFSKLFEGYLPYVYEMGELGRHYRAYAALMEHWHKVVPPEALMTVQYETLVDDLEGEARRIIAHCGLPWNDACLAFDKTERVVRTASATHVREPIFRTSMGRGQRYGAMLQPLLDALGP